MNKAEYPVVVQALCEEDGGGFLALAPDLVGCIGDGDTPQAAVTCLLEAMDEYADEMKRLGRSLPAPFGLADQIQREEDNLRKLVKAQADLIATQKELLSKQDASLKELSEAVAILSEDVRVEEVSFTVDDMCVHADAWPRSVRLMRARPLARPKARREIVSSH